MANQQQGRSRLNIAAFVCIVIGLVIGFGIKRVHIGLMIGLVLGLLSGSMFRRK